MASLQLPVFSVEQYLGWEDGSSEKHEFVDGYIVAMAGSSPEHSLIATNLSISIGRRCDCFVFNSDMRVRIEEARTWVYPDVAVVCGNPEFVETRPRTLVNPTVLVEVLSPSTASYDRNLKAPRYRASSSVREFLIVDQQPVHVEHWWRTPEAEWRQETMTDPDSELILQAIGIAVPIREVYRGVERL